MNSSYAASVTNRTVSKFAIPLAIVLVIAAGLVALRKPFNGDQALFITGARAMSHGAMLYRDFWDLKQPGIYGFYWLGIKLPGSPEVALHSLELLWFLAFAIVIIATLRHWFHLPIYAPLAAVLVCGLYFILCGSAELTQVEGLVNFPLYLTAWLLLWPTKSNRGYFTKMFLAGVATGCVIYLKLMLVLIPTTFFALMIIQQRKNNRSLIGCLLAILLFTLGGSVILGPVLTYYRAHDQIDLVYSTFTEIPLRINRELPHNPPIVLLKGFVWLVSRFGLLLPLTIFGAYRRRKSLTGWSLILWIILGLVLIALQGKGWGYHYLLLLTPIGILAAAGVEHLLAAAAAKSEQDSGQLLACVPVLLLGAYLMLGLAKALMQVKDPRPREYEPMMKEAAILLTPGAKAGPIYVLGDPLIYYLADRYQAVATNGWSPEWLLDNQWEQLAEDLRIARPNYIYLQKVNLEPINSRGAEFAKVLKSYYQKVREDETGAWYARAK